MQPERLSNAHLEAPTLDDAGFIASAYNQLLGRGADPKGFAGACRALRSGLHRRQFLCDLLASEEAELHLGQAKRQAMQTALRPGKRAILRNRLWRRWASLGVHPPSAVNHGLAGPTALPAPMSAAIAAERRIPAMLEKVVFTIAASNYMPQVQVLMGSLARAEPSCQRVLVLVDGLSGANSRPELPGVVVVPACDLGLPFFDDMGLRYNTLEFSTALKPFAFEALLDAASGDDQDQPPRRQVVYLDPDIVVYAPLHEAFDALARGASVAVTPHTLAPLTHRGHPSDHDILKGGVFNLGFMAVQDVAETRAYLQWWTQQLQTQCLVDFDRNLFTDQRWCDLLPCFVADLAVLRSPGMNVAYWNLEQRGHPSPHGAGWLLNRKAPLVFFHFSGFDPRHPSHCSRHQSRLTPEVLEPWLPLLQAYADALLAFRWQPPQKPTTPFEALPNGQWLPELLRQYYRAAWPTSQRGPRAALVDHLLREALETQGATGLPTLLVYLHQHDSNVQAAFDLTRPESATDFADWVRCCAIDQYHLHGLRPEPLSPATTKKT